MDLFRGVVPFVTVAEELSYRRAAERLAVSSAAVSKAVLGLEREVGVPLLLRTSRRVELTAEGRAFFERCREALGLVRAGREALSASRRRPTGRLTVTASFIVARPVLRAASDWKAAHPDVAVELRVSDRLVRLAGEEVDLGVRVGGPADDALVAHELRPTEWVTLASPSYLARRGTPRSPEDLGQHECVRFLGPRGPAAAWAFAGSDGAARRVRVRGRLDVDQGDLLLGAAEAGAGICQVLDFMVTAALREGRLVEILPRFRAAGPALFAVHLPAKRALPKVRLFVEQLRASFRALGDAP